MLSRRLSRAIEGSKSRLQRVAVAVFQSVQCLHRRKRQAVERDPRFLHSGDDWMRRADISRLRQLWRVVP